MKITKIIIIGTISLLLFGFTACTKNINFTNISPKDALELLKGDKNAVLIDVRKPEEFQVVRIPGSILVPDYEIKDKISEVVPDKNAAVIVYCRSGRRSSAAAKELINMGYTKVFDLGGITNWPYDTEGDES
jgi:rhodanese-related sulfurtransferase